MDHTAGDPPDIETAVDGLNDPVGVAFRAADAGPRIRSEAGPIVLAAAATIAAVTAGAVVWTSAALDPGWLYVVSAAAISTGLVAAAPMRVSLLDRDTRTLGPGPGVITRPASRAASVVRVTFSRQGVWVGTGTLIAKEVARWPWSDVAQIRIAAGPRGTRGIWVALHDGTTVAVGCSARALRASPSGDVQGWVPYLRRISATPGSASTPPAARTRLPHLAAGSAAVLLLVAGAAYVSTHPTAAAPPSGPPAEAALARLTDTTCIDGLLERRGQRIDRTSSASPTEVAATVEPPATFELSVETQVLTDPASTAAAIDIRLRVLPGPLEAHGLQEAVVTRWIGPADDQTASFTAGHQVTSALLTFDDPAGAMRWDRVWMAGNCEDGVAPAEEDLPQGAISFRDHEDYETAEITFVRGRTWVLVLGLEGGAPGGMAPTAPVQEISRALEAAL